MSIGNGLRIPGFGRRPGGALKGAVMKEAYRCVYMEDAIVAKSLLDSAGISSTIFSGDKLDVNPYFSVSVEGFRILVADEDFSDARAVVEDFESRRDS